MIQFNFLNCIGTNVFIFVLLFIRIFELKNTRQAGRFTIVVTLVYFTLHSNVWRRFHFLNLAGTRCGNFFATPLSDRQLWRYKRLIFLLCVFLILTARANWINREKTTLFNRRSIFIDGWKFGLFVFASSINQNPFLHRCLHRMNWLHFWRVGFDRSFNWFKFGLIYQVQFILHSSQMIIKIWLDFYLLSYN